MITINGLIRLSSNEIEDKTKQLLTYFRPTYFNTICATPLLEIVEFLKDKHNITFNFTSILGFNDDNYRILGAFNPKKRIILIDSSLSSDIAKFNFTLAHELGHLALHRNLEIKYSNDHDEQREETDNEEFMQEQRLKTDKDWMEWQANQYASALLMPKEIFEISLIKVQKEIGLSKVGKIYVDNQPCNEKSYSQILNMLSVNFKVSKSAIEYRLRKLNLIDNQRKGLKRMSNYL